MKWDYTERASSYDQRADYSKEALTRCFEMMGLSRGDLVADVGAGTGKLSGPLAQYGLRVKAVEPNDAMRDFGIKNSAGLDVRWQKASGEETGLQSDQFAGVFFGSSFNVVDQALALKEAARLLIPGGYFACMWNHRDLNDPLQRAIEELIQSKIADYSYGKRRQDPTAVIEASGLFESSQKVESTFVVPMTKERIVTAWRSHETLARQAGEAFSTICDEIHSLIPDAEVGVPYTTRIWVARHGG